MSPSEHKPTCPKCGAKMERLTYERTTNVTHIVVEEWLRRGCGTCGYWTREACADDPERAVPLTPQQAENVATANEEAAA